ncbi:MAG: AsmA-like C-terminal region-containing protein [Verrucomicrobiales bacterium]|nr:AsmA-like C-terminal region-containing protein [Verrucomicrobiales bacterium]
MRWIRRLFVFFCLIATAFVIWGAIYARKQGFTESWRNLIEDEFSDRGYYTEIGKVTLGAFRGLVAEDVTFYQDVKKTQPVAFLNDVYLDVELSRILNKEVSVNTLDVQEARMSLPLEPGKPDGRRLQVEGLSGRIVITESMIEIVKVEASVADLDVYLKGTLIRPSRSLDGNEEEESATQEDRFLRVRSQLLATLNELEKYEFVGDRPQITIEFRGDLDELETITAEAVIESGNFRQKGQPYEIEELSGRVRFDGLDRTAEIEEMVLRDEQGELNLSGGWNEASGLFEFQLESDADIPKLAGLFVQDRRLGEIVFFNPPGLKAQGHIDCNLLGTEEVGFPGEIMGEFQAERFVSRGTVFTGLDFGFSLSGEKYYLRNLRLDHQSGVAFLNLKYDPYGVDETIQYQTEIKLDPHIFRPFFDEGGRKFIDAWRFEDTSAVYLAAAGRGGSWDMRTWENKGVIDLRNFALNGVDFIEMEADFESEGVLQWFRNIAMVREDGRIDAEVAQHNTALKLWEVKGVESTMPLSAGAKAFSPKLSKALSAYRFENPPLVRLSGTLDSRRPEEVGDEPRRTRVEIAFESEGLAEYDFIGKTLRLTNSSGTLAVDRSRVHLRSMRAEVLGGELRLEYDAKNVRSPDRPFDATMQISGIPMEAVTKLYADTESVKGSVAGTFNLSGNAARIASYNGHGLLEITNGNLFAIPVLGPLSKAIAKANPNQESAGHSIAREASASLTIENGVLKTDDLEAFTDTFRVRAAGQVSLVDQSVDFEAIVNPRDGITRAVLTPVSELLTFSCTGTVQDPVWKAKHISNLGKIPAQAITEITNIPVEGIRRIGQGLFGESKKERGAGESIREETGGEPNRRKLFQLLPQRNQTPVNP